MCEGLQDSMSSVELRVILRFDLGIWVAMEFFVRESIDCIVSTDVLFSVIPSLFRKIFSLSDFSSRCSASTNSVCSSSAGPHFIGIAFAALASRAARYIVEGKLNFCINASRFEPNIWGQKRNMQSNNDCQFLCLDPRQLMLLCNLLKAS
jgi:hypothetical protein